MPYGDGTGPNGEGPGTGRGMGPCVPGPVDGVEEQPADVMETQVNPNDRPFPDQVWLKNDD